MQQLLCMHCTWQTFTVEHAKLSERKYLAAEIALIVLRTTHPTDYNPRAEDGGGDRERAFWSF